MKREEEINRFLVKSDSGKLYTVIEFQQYISIATLRNPKGEAPSLKRWATTTGFHLNNIDSETFKVVETDEIVRKI